MLRLFLLAFLPMCLAREDQPWQYSGENGQQIWCDVSKFCCGSRQSPIPLYYPLHYFYPFRLYGWTSKHRLQLVDYEIIPQNVTVTNNGKTVEVKFSDDVTPEILIEEDGLENRYKFNALHFHWGKISNRGSEHTINGHRFPMEMHLVHFKSRFSTLEDAVSSGEKDAVAVLSVMFEIPHNDNRYSCKTPTKCTYNSAINKISSSLTSVPYNEQSTRTEQFSLRELLPKKLNDYFRYYGSFSTPNCTEVVVWTVFAEPNFISENQLEKFRNLFSTKKDEKLKMALVDNFRFLQTGSFSDAIFVRTPKISSHKQTGLKPFSPKKSARVISKVVVKFVTIVHNDKNKMYH